MQMFQRNSKKDLPLPSRPDQPSVAEIVSDVNASAANDIVFTYFQNETHEVQSPGSNFSDSTFTFDQSRLSSQSIYSPEGLSSPEPDERMRGDKPVHQVYQKAVDFLTQTERLQVAGPILDEACDQLNLLSTELSNSIDALREQAHTIIQ